MNKRKAILLRRDTRKQFTMQDVSLCITAFHNDDIVSHKKLFINLCELVRPLVYRRVRCSLGPGEDNDKRWHSGGDPHPSLDAMLKNAALHNQEHWGMKNYTRVHVDVLPCHHEHRCTMHPPSVQVTLRCDIARACGVDMSKLVQDVLRLTATDDNCWHATVDADYTLGYMNNGLIYGSIPVLPMSWNTWCDWWDWATSKTRERHVRIVNWGNYLGPRMVRSIPKDAFDSFDSLKWNKEYPQSAGCVVRMPSGGVYIQLSRDPEDVVNLVNQSDLEEHPIVANAVWLRQLLRAHGML